MHLTELFRQAAESAIVVTAHGVNRGEMPAMKSAPNSDFFFLPAADPQAAQRLIVDLVARRLPAKYGFDPLSPISRCSRRCIAGRRASSRSTRRCRRGSIPRQRARWPLATTRLRTGDKVMQVRNNYDKGAGGVFNGDLGRILEVTDERQVVVAFPDGAGRCPSPTSCTSWTN